MGDNQDDAHGSTDNHTIVKQIASDQGEILDATPSPPQACDQEDQQISRPMKEEKN